MLSKKYRLSRREIEELKSKKGSVLQGKFLGLVFQPQKEEQKFALILSNKIAKKSTARNEIKRLFFRVLQKELLNFPKGKFLFLAKKSCLNTSLKEFEDEIKDFGVKLDRLLS